MLITSKKNHTQTLNIATIYMKEKTNNNFKKVFKIYILQFSYTYIQKYACQKKYVTEFLINTI